MRVEHKEITDTNYYSVVSRIAVLIEEALLRNREILHTSILAYNGRFYGCVIYREGKL